MKTDFTPDVDFLADSLAALVRLNYRYFRADPEIAKLFAEKLASGGIRWTNERADKWVDAQYMYENNVWDVDCEEIIGIFCAIMLCCYGFSACGIRQVTAQGLCHCIAKDENHIFDPCLQLQMNGPSHGKPAIWREMKEEKMPHVFGSVLKGIFEPFAKKSREPANETAGSDDENENLETGASIADSLAGYLIPGSLIGKVTQLENDLAKTKKQHKASNDAKLKAEKQVRELQKQIEDSTLAWNKEKVALQKDLQSKSSGLNACEKKLQSKENLLSAANAHLSSCRNELKKIETRLAQQKPELVPEFKKTFGDFSGQFSDAQLAQAFADKWADDGESIYTDLMTLGTLREQAESLACCESCAHDGPCESECKDGSCGLAQTAGSDEHVDSDTYPGVSPFFGGCLPCQK